jgi:catechol 2,3-dioxygenase-like lactoylglutathione lyase family enzyme
MPPAPIPPLADSPPLADIPARADGPPLSDIPPPADIPARSARPLPAQAHRILRISRVVTDLARAEAFYRDALAFRTIRRGPIDPTTRQALGTGNAQQTVMRLNQQEIALIRFTEPGRPYPADSHSNDLWFQHLAIVVADMHQAYAHLSEQPGWRPITRDGPALLPPANGAVRAFKFRDPDGHPLELLWFPPGKGRPLWQHPPSGSVFLGIDHSALSIQATTPSLTFYRRIGLTVGSRSFNHGPAQDHLDGLDQTQVRVTGLRPIDPDSTGLELLAYTRPGRSAILGPPTDTATDWVTLAVTPPPAPTPQAVRDPDGHLLLLVAQCATSTGAPA